MKTKPCKDCTAEGVTTNRPAPHPGPRCTTHHRAVKKVRKSAAHEAKVQAVYGLNPGEYEALYALQGGRCAILKCRATGARKKLAVDHNHQTGEVRGLLCGPHNQAIGYNSDSPEVFLALADYLINPPARQILDPREWPGVTSSNTE